MSLRKWKFDHLIDHAMMAYLENIKRAIEDEAAGKIKPVLKDKPAI